MKTLLLIGALVGSSLFAACAPVPSSVPVVSGQPTQTGQAVAQATRLATTPKDLPYADAPVNSWQGQLRLIFQAVRSLDLKQVEGLDFLYLRSGVVGALDGAVKVDKFDSPLTFTPLERERWTGIVGQVGQTNLNAVILETIRTSNFDKVRVVQDLGDAVKIYFLYRQVDLASAITQQDLVRTFGGNAPSEYARLFGLYDQRPLALEAEWSFIKYKGQWLPVFDNDLQKKPSSVGNFLLSYLGVANRLIQQR